MSEDISFFKINFWDLWLQKVFRNLASLTFWVMIMLYIPFVWGMFHINPHTNLPWVSDVVGGTLFGGGFITLAGKRMYTRLREGGNHEGLDTDG